MPVLDTTFLVDSHRDPKRMKALQERLLSEEEALLVPVHAAIEFCMGLADPNEGFRRLERAFEVAPCDANVAREAARLGRALQAEGKRLSPAALHIAATASWHGMPIVTRDRRFEEASLRVITYER